jgi:PAS domain S-box-containing protein
MKNYLGHYVKARRLALKAEKEGFSIRQLASRVGVHHSYLSKLERGESAPLTEKRMCDLARELGEDPELLLALAGKLSARLTSLAAKNPPNFLNSIRKIIKRGRSWPEFDVQSLPELLQKEIKERTSLEQKLKFFEDEREAILDNLRNTVVEYLDKNLNLLWVSDAALKQLGCTRAEVIGGKCHKALKRCDAPCTHCAAIKSIETGKISEQSYVSEDGRRWVLRGVPLTDESGEVTRVFHFSFDVTSLENAEQALADSERRWRLALEGAKMGVWEIGEEIEQLYLSPQWLHMLGYAEGETLPELSKMVHPDEYVEVHEEFRRHLSGEIPIFDSEHRLLCKDGSWKWVHARGMAVKDEQNTIQRVVGVMFDVDDQKTAELELKASEARHRDLFEQAPIGIYTASAGGAYIAVNPRLAELFGYVGAKDMMTRVRKVEDCLENPGDWRRLIRLLERRGLVMDFERRVRRADGSLVWTSSTLRAERNATGQISSVIAFVQDVQAAKEAEAAMDQARRQLSGVMEQLEAGVFVLDPLTNKIIYANTFLKKNLGFDMVGREPESMFSGDQANPFLLEETSFFNYGDALSRDLLLINGRWHLCQAKVAPWPGMSKVILVVATDIMEMKQAEEVREDVERIMRHDLKSPLSGVINIPDLILESVELPEEETRLLEAVKSAGRKMLRLINESLALRQMELGTFILKKETVDILRLVQEVLDENSVTCLDLGVSLRLRRRGLVVERGDTLNIAGDVDLLGSLFSNLIKNGIEATPYGQSVQVDMDDHGEMLQISIWNPGRVPPEVEQRFFEKYATAGKAGGTGLGTYSALLIAKAHEGDIIMKSSAQAGTTVTVILPYTHRGEHD